MTLWFLYNVEDRTTKDKKAIVPEETNRERTAVAQVSDTVRPGKRRSKAKERKAQFRREGASAKRRVFVSFFFHVVITPV